MSVRAGERKNSHLKYIQQAQQLSFHTFQLCNNENHFPEPVLANSIKTEVLLILRAVRYAFSTATYNRDDEDSLFKYFLDVLAHIDALYALLDLAYNDNTYKIDPESMEYWVGLVVVLEDSIKNLTGLEEKET